MANFLDSKISIALIMVFIGAGLGRYTAPTFVKAELVRPLVPELENFDLPLRVGDEEYTYTQFFNDFCHGGYRNKTCQIVRDKMLSEHHSTPCFGSRCVK